MKVVSTTTNNFCFVLSLPIVEQHFCTIIVFLMKFFLPCIRANRQKCHSEIAHKPCELDLASDPITLSRNSKNQNRIIFHHFCMLVSDLPMNQCLQTVFCSICFSSATGSCPQYILKNKQTREIMLDRHHTCLHKNKDLW